MSGTDFILKVSGFLILPIYLYLMPKDEFGEYGYILSAVLVLPGIITLGIYVSQIRISCGTEDINYRKNIYSSTLLVSTFIALIFILVFTILSNYVDILGSIFKVNSNSSWKAFALAVLILFSTLNFIVYSCLIVKNITSSLVLYNVIKFILLNIFSIFSILMLVNIDTVASRLIGFAISEVLLFMLGISYFTKDYWVLKFDYSYIKKAIKFSLPIVPGSLATFVTLLSDRYFISRNFDIAYVAEYNLAMMFLVPIQMVMASAQTSIAPQIYSMESSVKAHKESSTLFIKMTLMYGVILAITVLFLLLAQHLHIIPKTYTDTYWLVPLLSVGVMASTLLQIPFNYFIYMKKSLYVLYVSLIVAVLTVLYGAIIIPSYGYIGAGISAGILNFAILVLVIKYTFYMKK